MKTIALLLVLAALSSALDWTSLRVRWGYNSQDPEHTKIFFEIPRTLDDAASAGWVDACIEQFVPNVSTWCLPDDPRFCALFDSYGFIAGVQAGILVDDVSDVQSFYNMSRVNEFQTKTMFGEEVWTSTAFTQSPADLAKGGRSSTFDNLTGIEGVWLQGKNGYLEVPRNLTGLNSIWVEEACIQTIGQHYFYDMLNTTDCKDFEPWFLLYQGQILGGIGFQSYGKRTSQERVWYENITTDQVRAGIADGPQCLYDWSDAYGGVISMHAWFTPDPWTITCP